jgi:S-adenosylmethionine uptake transporter
MTTAYGKGKTLLTGALSYSTVVFSTLLGIAMFGDVLPAWSWVGIACIIGSGVLAIQFAPGKSAAAEE